MKAYRALGRFRQGSPFRPGLQIVANEARVRAALRRPPRGPCPARGREGSSGGAAPSPEGILLAGEDRERLLAAVNGLREEERLVIACRYFLELSEEETSAALGIRPRDGQVAHLAGAGAPAGERMPELDAVLVELGRQVEFPPTPDLASAVRRSSRASRVRGAGRLRSRSPSLVVAARRGTRRAAARTAILDWLGLAGRARSPASTSSARAGRSAASISAVRVTLAEATPPGAVAPRPRRASPTASTSAPRFRAGRSACSGDAVQRAAAAHRVPRRGVHPEADRAGCEGRAGRRR